MHSWGEARCRGTSSPQIRTWSYGRNQWSDRREFQDQDWSGAYKMGQQNDPFLSRAFRPLRPKIESQKSTKYKTRWSGGPNGDSVPFYPRLSVYEDVKWFPRRLREFPVYKRVSTRPIVSHMRATRFAEQMRWFSGNCLTWWGDTSVKKHSIEMVVSEIVLAAPMQMGRTYLRLIDNQREANRD